jgi:hypothetical protein
MAKRHFPPWSVEELDACFVVKDHGGQNWPMSNFEDESGPAMSGHRGLSEGALCVGPSKAGALTRGLPFH